MKKFICVFLSVLLTVSCVTGLSVFAEETDVYPESEHDYQNNIFQEWEYTYPMDADGLFITFSEETSLDPETIEENDGLYLSEDYISFIDEASSQYSYFYEKQLSGKTLYVKGNKFTIGLHTNSAGTDYGFSFDRISHIPPENETLIRYHFGSPDEVDYYDCFGEDEAVLKYFQPDEIKRPGYAFAGWSSVYGGEIERFAGDRFEAGRVHDLYAVWEELLIDSEDSFSFLNHNIGGHPIAEDKYYMTEEHYNMMLANLFKNFGLGPIPGPIAAAVLSTYPSWEHVGSCYGMAALVFLNYHGVVDLLGDQDAENLSDLKLSPELISTVNYYQAQAASSFLCENAAPDPDSALYSEQLRKMYESVENGNPVLFHYYKGKYVVETGHAVTLTGAFTDFLGNHYVCAYDSNYRYTQGECHYYRISPDFTRIYDSYLYPDHQSVPSTRNVQTHLPQS